MDDHDGLPVPDATKIHPDLCFSYVIGWGGDAHQQLAIWHWCTRAKWLADPSRDPLHCQPQWMVSGVAQHELVSLDPLHLEPSLYWPDCCGMHGFLRAGRWQAV